MKQITPDNKAFTKTNCPTCRSLVNISWEQYNKIVVTGSGYIVCGTCKSTLLCKSTPSLDTHKV